ncbi:MAG TPA: hypothetical protein VLV15_07755, partial [Dongiaceae bacterium]|nr:hypothetical protein [Dongiaceae bacterium]
MAEPRVAQAWTTLRTTFLRPAREGAIEVHDPQEGGRAPLWPTGQVLAAAIDVGDGLDTARAVVRGLSDFRRGDAY